MSFSYSGLTNYGKATLPSVVGGLGSMNILRDPPKSIHTRRRNKVGETSSLTEMIDQSGNRVCEAISTYARGVNPCVSVSYNNLSIGGGNGSMSAGGGRQASLPYKVNRNGAFRPPIIRAEQLMPLSRQPRTNTTAFTNPGFADFTKKMLCPGGDYRAINKNKLRTFIRPTGVYNIETPIQENYEVKYVIKNPVKFTSRAGKTLHKFSDAIIQENMEPTYQINNKRLKPDPKINKSGETVRYIDNSHLNTDKYIQDTLHSSVQSKRSKSIQVNNSHLDTNKYIQNHLNHSVESNKNSFMNITPLEDIINIDINVRDNPIHVNYTAPKSDYVKENYIHKDKELQRRVLQMTAATNKTRNIHSRPQIEHISEQKRNRPVASANTNLGTYGRHNINDISSREYSLKKTINPGGMIVHGHIPRQASTRNHPIVDSHRSQMNRKIMEMQHGRR